MKIATSISQIRNKFDFYTVVLKKDTEKYFMIFLYHCVAKCKALLFAHKYNDINAINFPFNKIFLLNLTFKKYMALIIQIFY